VQPSVGAKTVLGFGYYLEREPEHRVSNAPPLYCNAPPTCIATTITVVRRLDGMQPSVGAKTVLVFGYYLDQEQGCVVVVEDVRLSRR